MNVFVGYPKENIGYSFHSKAEGKVFYRQEWLISWEGVSRESFEWRTIELDEVNEPKQYEQSGATPEAVPEAATAPMAPAPTKCYSPRDRDTYWTL